MMNKNLEIAYRSYVRQMSKVLAGQPLDLGMSIKPSRVRGKEGLEAQVRKDDAEMTDTKVKRTFEGHGDLMRYFLSGAATLENYAKCEPFFSAQNKLLECFCRLVTNTTGEN